MIERLVVINEDSVLTIKHLPFEVSAPRHQPIVVQVNEPVSFEDAVEILEKELIRKTMQVYPTTRQAAKVLGVSHPTVIRKLQKYKLSSR